jgi:hypothetical protein
MSDEAVSARLFIAPEALQPAGCAPTTRFAELNEKLQQAGNDFPSLHGRPYEECVSRFGADLLADLIRLMEESDSGWFVRGVWGQEREPGDQAEVLDRSIFSFHLSLRTVHCLSGADLRTIRQVVGCTEYQLLHIKNLGRKSLNEIKELLANFGLELGQTVEPPLQKPRQPWWDVNLYYLLPLDSLQLTGPVIHGLKKRGMLYIGSLASQTGLASVASSDLDRALLAVNMGFGEQIPEWQRRHFPQLHEFFKSELQAHLTSGGAKAPEESLKEALANATTLEEELRILACWACSEQTARTGMRYLGWDGQGGTTLEQTASEVGVSRERVRQIQSQLVDKITPLAVRPVLLIKAVEVLGESLPCLAAKAERRLRDAQVSEYPFRAEGVLTAASVFGLNAGLVMRLFGGERFIVREKEADALDKLVQVTVDLALARGVARVSDIIFEGDPELARDLLEHSGEVAWLDDEREWFWVPKARSNRILSRVRQILSTVPDLSLETIRAVLLWKERIADSGLPSSVLRSLLSQQPWCRCEGPSVSLLDESGRKAAKNSTEYVMFQVLSENGGVLHIEDFVERCGERGVTAGAINVLRPSSTLIKFEASVCKIVGTTADQPPAERTGFPSVVPVGHRLAFGVLRDLDQASPAFVVKAAEQLLARAAGLGLGQGRAWSLIELSLTPDDFAKLRDWGRYGAADSRTLASAGHSSLGLVMTAYCMDVARHEATEGEMWPQVYDSLGPGLRHTLFSSPGQPRQRIRDAMEYACRKLQLRHVFGSEGAQAWLRTVYLQFGVSDAGWKRLPWWLSGQNFPISVFDLLRPESPLHSESFAELWHVLQEFRWRAVTRGEARLKIVPNPWVSGIGADLALDLAESHREVEPIEKALTPENETLLAVPKLGLRGETPCFEIELARPVPEWMSEPRYVLVLGDSARVQVMRNDEGEYQIAGGSVALMPEQPAAPVDLLKDGISVLPEPFTLEFYGVDEEIAAFDFKTGRKLDVWEPIQQARPFALLCAPDVCLHPAASERRFMFAGQRMLSIYRSGIPEGLTATLDGEPLWSPLEALPQKTSSCSELVARCGGGAWGESVPVEVRVEPEMQVRKLLVAGRALKVVSAEGEMIRFESISLTPELETEKHAVLEILNKGRLRRIPTRFEAAPCHGAALESGGKWQVLDATTRLDRADLARKRLFVRPPEFFDSQRTVREDWALLEGTNFCGRPRLNREFHSFVYGFGQSLEIGLGPYNRVGDRRITISQAITDFGGIKSVSRSGERWQIAFRHRVEPETIRVVAWTASGILNVPHTAIEWDDAVCSVACPFFETAPVVFGACYDGVCVGTGIVEDPPYSQLCSLIEGSEDWEMTARFLRWFHLPVMESHVRNSIASRIAGNECRTLRVWTESGCPPAPGLRQEDANRDRWHYVLRRFFERWRPRLADAGDLIQHFGLLCGDPARDLDTCWERHDELLSIHPVLLAAVADLGISSAYPEYPEARRIFLEMLQNMCLDLPRNSGGAERQRTEQEYLDEAARSIGVDPAFILRSLLVDARRLCSREQVKPRNLRIALAIRPFRQWLAAKLISDYDTRI